MNKSSNIEAIYPLSPLQQGILFHAVYDPESNVYFEQLCCEIRGDLNVAGLRRAWQAVVDLHPILRTGFFWQRRKTPLQAVLRSVSLPWDQQDWRGLPEAEQQHRLDAYLQSDRKRGFALSKAPLMRVALMRRAESVYYLIWSHHHLLLDGWSVPIVLKDVFAFYDAFSEGLEIQLEAAASYDKHIAWLRRQDKAKAEEFWRRALRGFTSPTPLPTDRDAADWNGEGESYDEQKVALTASSTAALRLAAQAHSLTLNVIAQAAWALFLSCYSGRDDVLFGAVVSGRPASLPGAESMVGLFVNTIPIRVKIDREANLLDWLRGLQEQQIELLEHEHSSLVDIQGVSEIPRGTSLFDSIFVFENYPIQPVALKNGAIEVSDVRVFERTNYPIAVTAAPGTELALDIGYDRRLFEETTIAEILRSLKGLLEAILADPGRRLADVISFAGRDTRLPTRTNQGVVRGESARFFARPRQSEQSSAAPRNLALEESITSTWVEVLGLESVEANDNFFELGGHSLLAMRVISRLQDVLQCELPVRIIFESPTVAGLARTIGSIIGLDKGEEDGEGDRSRRHPDREFPLSCAQERLWFVDQLDPGNPAYNLPEAIRIEGPLNAPALNQCLTEIVRRHAVLRSAFRMIEGDPAQVVGEPRPVGMQLVGLSGTTDSTRENLAKRLLVAEATRAFDLRSGPLLRVALARMKSHDHLILLTLHHIVADAWSSAVMVREVTELYQAFASGEPSPLQELPVQYADFSVWQRQQLQSDSMQALLSYWKQHLTGAPALLRLPTDRPRPRILSHRGASALMALKEDVTEQLKRLSRREGATLFVTMLTALKVLLARYSGERDIVVGVPVAGRTRAEFENLIGFFVNNLVIRTRLDPEASFQGAMKAEKEAVMGALAHQDLPFERIIDELRPERSLSHAPLFQVAFNFVAMPIQHVGFAELSLTPVELEVGISKFDLVLAVGEIERTLLVDMRYATDLFDPATVDQMIGHFRRLLDEAVAKPQQPISAMPLLAPAERQRLLADRNPKRLRPGNATLVHELFDRQARESPVAVALVYGEFHVSYAELDRRANQLARHLQIAGIRAESLVGIFMERSVEMVLSALAVLKSGGGYVPLDPLFPPERVSLLLEETGVEVVLTGRRAAHRLPKTEALVIDLDSEWAAVSRLSDERPVSLATVDNLAYVVYTSGSTGLPKGVMIAHGGVCNLAHSQIAAFEVGPDCRVLQFAPFTFDASVSEMYTALLSGATLCIVDQQHLLPGEELIELLRDEAITVVTLPPSVLMAMRHEELPALRTLIAAGEACSEEIVERWAAGRRFLNAYGPTESTVCATIAEIRDHTSSALIGKPMANIEAHLLDDHQEPAPDRVVGEVYLGGMGLSRGYVSQAAPTAERFIPNPFSSTPGARLYRTGDLARYRRDGQIEYIGRRDHQVKVRGYRIELGEIEENLKRIAAVANAVAVIREGASGEKVIAAFVVMKGSGVADASALRRSLAKRLPEYMLPHYLIALEKMPLLANGKIDRTALPAPEPARAKPAESYQPPRTELETLLVAMWQEMLGIERIGVFDRFFELGGDSMRAAIFTNKLQEMFREVVHVVALFDAPTIAELAPYLELHCPAAVTRICGNGVVDARGVTSVKTDSSKETDHAVRFPGTVREIEGPAPQPPKAVAIDPGPANVAQATGRAWSALSRVLRIEGVGLPLSFGQQRLWFLNRLDPQSPFYNIPLVVRLIGALDVGAFEKGINEVVRRHEVLRSRFVVSDGRPEQVIESGLTVPVQVTDLSTLEGEDREAGMRRVVEEASATPFDLETGPLLRATLVKLSDEDHVAAVVMHHIVGDEWSVGVFVSEIAALYNAFLDRKPSPLPELPVQYADFAVWQRQWLQGEVLEEQLSYWKQQLSGAPGVLQLPADRVRPPIQSFRGSSCSLSLEDRLAEQVRQLSRRESVTLFVTMLTAFKLLLLRYTGQEDLVVGVPVAGRTRAEVEGLIGFFINALIMRTRLRPDAGFRDTLRREKQVVLGAFAHQDLPFEKIVDELQPDRSLSHSPLFQVAFNYLNQPPQPLEMRGLSFGEVEFEVGTAKYDIVFGVVESGKDLSVHARYCTDLFDRTTIEKLLGHFRIMLEGAVAGPSDRISGLPLLTEAERAQLLIERNDTTRELATHTLVHGLVDLSARELPNATALTCGGAHITYGELNRRANLLANHLHSLGIGPEAIVGICMKSSPEMVIAMLGVLRSGAGYLPLDPDYPAGRLASIIEDSMIPLLITLEELDERVPTFSGQVVYLDAEWRRIRSLGDEGPGVTVLPENLAYVIYTSGSTGTPKGVQISHRGLLNLVFWHLSRFEVTPSDRATQVAGVGFDASVWEIWPYLAVGACLSLAEEGIRTSPAELQTWMMSSQATIGFLSTPLAERALALDWPEGACLRTLLTGGDRLHHHVRPGLGFALVNNYGPTEYTVVATSGVVDEREADADEAPSIGRPITNSQVYVSSRERELAPDRVAGELLIGGASLARAYLFDAELTAQKFIPNPFSAEPGARLYRSGDLVRMRPDGSIEFLGRMDDQVKIRGFRIEAGDVEAALAQHPGVVDSVVLTDAGTSGESRLVAYVVADPKQAPSIGELRTQLREKLPEYMVPAAFVMLSALPLTSNGKVDRRALPAPDHIRFGLDQELVPPRTELERYLARKWSEVLGTDQIGVYDSFFDVGGESLKAAVLVNSIQQELGEMLQVVTIFDAPTVADFAAYLSDRCAPAVARLLGVEREGARKAAPAGGPARRVDEHKIVQMRQLVVPLPPRELPLDSATKNGRAIFILSSPRSGSTLLRVMLGGHPLLFAPPELELMSFNTLAERREAFSGRDSFWQEGAIRAVMEIRRCNADQARRIIEECEDVGLTVRQFYGLLQSWLGDRLLVDKTPSYALDPEILERLEMDFEDALYIHLVRSPQGMIRSYEEAKLEQLFPRFKHPFEASELAEIVWVVSHQNILNFLKQVESRRQHRIRFEDLVSEPKTVVSGICRFVGVEYHPDMIEPYKDKEKKMTDGIHKESRMLGDIKFHQHSAIDPAAAESWRGHVKDRFLADATLDLAGLFGYVPDKAKAPQPVSSDTALRPIEKAGADSVTEQMLAQLNSLSDDQLDSLLTRMLNEGDGN